MLTQEWSEFIEGGVALVLGCCDSKNETDAVRGIGAVVGLDRKTVTLYAQRDSAMRVLPILQEHGAVAVAIAQPSTYKTIQLKGRYKSSREADARDRVILERYRELFFDEVNRAGIPAGVIRRIVSWPALALELEVENVYLATPGPGAGKKLL